MSKAEERAFERCPKSEDVIEEMRNEIKRAQFIEGYYQAEKDLELTVGDIMKIDALLIEMWNKPSNEDKYQEVLKRFKDFKEAEK